MNIDYSDGRKQILGSIPIMGEKLTPAYNQ